MGELYTMLVIFQEKCYVKKIPSVLFLYPRPTQNSTQGLKSNDLKKNCDLSSVFCLLLCYFRFCCKLFNCMLIVNF